MKNPEWQNAKGKLHKAMLMRMSWSWRRPYFGRFRLANAIEFKVWWLHVSFRAPWLEDSARALYPHLFNAAAHTQVGAA